MQAVPRRAALAACVVAVLAGSLGPAAGASPSPGPRTTAPPAVAGPGAAPQLSVHPLADPVAALLTRSRDTGGPVAGAVAAARAAAVARGGVGGPPTGSPYAPLSEAPPTTTDSAVGAVGTLGGGVTVLGDVTGDGLADLAHQRSRAGEALALEVRRGTDGALVWRRDRTSLDDRLLPLGRDVSGDGVVDVLATADRTETVRDDSSGDCRTGACRTDVEVLLLQDLRVLDGRTGATLERLQRTGRYAYRQEVTVREDATGSERRETRELDLTGLVVPLALGGPRPGLLVQDYSVESRRSTSERVDGLAGAVEYGGATTEQESLRSRSTYAVHGAGGAGSPTVDTGWIDGSALAEVAADLTGDGQDDLLTVELVAPARSSSCERLLVRETCSPSGAAPSRRVVLRDGVDLALGWAAEAAADAVAVPVGADLDGDGAADVLLVGTGPPGAGTGTGSTAAHSGRDGSRLWAHDRALLPLTAVPSEAATGPDLLLVERAPGGDGGSLAVERRDGAAGTLLRRTLHVAPALPPSTEPNFPSVVVAEASATLASDRDGDTLPEVVVSTYRIRFTDQRGNQSVSRSAVESGRSGAATVLHEGGGLVLAVGSRDLDGDGRGELLVATGEDAGFSTRAVGAGPLPLWEAPGLQPVSAAGDLDGSPGAELVGDSPEALVVRGGADYALRWQS